MNETGSLEVLWRRKHLLLLGALLGIVAAVMFGNPGKVIAVDHYQSSDALYVNPDVSGPEMASRYAYLAMSSSVPADVADQLEGYDAAEVREKIVIESDPALGSLTVLSAGHTRQASAVELVETFGDQLMAFLGDGASQERAEEVARLEQRVQETRVEVETLQAQEPVAGPDGVVPPPPRLLEADLTAALADYSLARQDLATVKAAQAANYAPLERLRPVVAELEVEQESSDPLGAAGRLAIGAIVGLVLGGALAFFIHRFDSRLYSRADVEGAFQVPVIGEIPKLPRRWRKRRGLVTAVEPSSPAAEAFRQLRSTLSAIHIQRLRRLAQSPEARPGTREEMILLVASPGPGDGKSTTIANLAKSFVDAGRSVIVVSGDLRRPTMHEFLQADAAPGLSEAIQEGLEPARVGELIRPTAIPGVQLLPHGETVDNPGELLGASRGLILAARDLADVILIDSPPVLIGNDVSELVPVADGILLVARVGRSTAEQAHRTRDAIDRLAAPVLGVVLVGSDELMRGVSYYGGYGKRQTWRTRAAEAILLRREWFGRRPQPTGDAGSGGATLGASPLTVDLDRLGRSSVPARENGASPSDVDLTGELPTRTEPVDRPPPAEVVGDNGSKDRPSVEEPEPAASTSDGTEQADSEDHPHEPAVSETPAGVDLASLRRRVLLEHRHRPGGSPAPGAASRDDGPS